MAHSEYDETMDNIIKDIDKSLSQTNISVGIQLI